jgi:chromosome segregation ATPase
MAGVLDTIIELKKRGFSDAEIITQLRSMNYSAQEINDAINQIKIKSAVNEKEEMQPSIMQSAEEEAEKAEGEEIAVPMPSKKKKIKVATMQYPPAYQPYAAAYPSETYEQPQQAAAQTDIETIEEIAEEIVSEKFAEIRDKISGILDFRENIETRINNLNDRLKRIESSIDNLQAALLGKVQEYSQDIKSLGSEMHALEGAFGKILNPLVDNVKELGRLTEKMKGKEKGR